VTKQFATPGPRAIYPELCASPSLGRCSILANALFPRLIAMADDQGRLLGDPQSVLIECMGRLLGAVTVNEVVGALDELEREAIVLRYSSGGREYLQLVGWWRWQNGQRRAFPSRWPSPKGWQDLVYANAAAEPNTWEEAVVASAPRNAAIRGVSRRLAASRAGPHAGACVRARARAVPSRADADAVPSGARAAGPGANGAEPAGGLRASAQAVLDNPSSSEEARAGARAMLDLKR